MVNMVNMRLITWTNGQVTDSIAHHTHTQHHNIIITTPLSNSFVFGNCLLFHTDLPRQLSGPVQ